MSVDDSPGFAIELQCITSEIKYQSLGDVGSGGAQGSPTASKKRSVSFANAPPRRSSDEKKGFAKIPVLRIDVPPEEDAQGDEEAVKKDLMNRLGALGMISNMPSEKINSRLQRMSGSFEPPAQASTTTAPPATPTGSSASKKLKTLQQQMDEGEEYKGDAFVKRKRHRSGSNVGEWSKHNAKTRLMEHQKKYERFANLGLHAPSVGTGGNDDERLQKATSSRITDNTQQHTLLQELLLSGTTARELDEMIASDFYDVDEEDEETLSRASLSQDDLTTDKDKQTGRLYTWASNAASKPGGGCLSILASVILKFMQHKDWVSQRKKNKTRDLPEEQRLDLASVYIADALNSREPKIHRIRKWPSAAYKFYWDKHWRLFIIALVLLNMGIILLEPASFASDAGTDGEISKDTIIGVEFAFISIFFFDNFLLAYALGWKEFLRDKWRLVNLLVNSAILVDLVRFAAVDSTFLFSRVLRPLLLVIHLRGVRNLVVSIVKTLPSLLDAFVTLALVIITFGAVGIHLFSSIYSETKDSLDNSFRDIGTTFSTLFVFLSTTSYPDLMNQAYEASRWYLLYFLSFVMLCSFILMNMIAAVIYDNYKVTLKKQVFRNRILERKALVAAFEILDKDRSGYLDKDTFTKLFHRLGRKNDIEVEFSFQAIDEDGSGTIDIMEFFELCDVLLLRFRKERNRSNYKHPIFRKMFINPKMKYIASHRYFVILENTLIVASVFAMVLYGLQIDDGNHRSVDATDFTFTLIFVFELLFKLFAIGPPTFFASKWNILDAVVVSLAFIAQICIFVPSVTESNVQNYFRAIASLRLLRAFRLSRNFTSFQVFLRTFVAIIPVMVDVSLLYIALMYMYAVVGLELFVATYNVDPNSSFGGFGRLYLSLFQVVVGNDWNDLMNEAADETGNSAASLFITSFYIVGVILLYNVVIAIILDFYTKQREIVTAELLVKSGNADSSGTRKKNKRDSERSEMSDMSDRRKSRESDITEVYLVEQGRRGWSGELVGPVESDTRLRDFELEELKEFSSRSNLISSPTPSASSTASGSAGVGASAIVGGGGGQSPSVSPSVINVSFPGSQDFFPAVRRQDSIAPLGGSQEFGTHNIPAETSIGRSHGKSVMIKMKAGIMSNMRSPHPSMIQASAPSQTSEMMFFGGGSQPSLSPSPSFSRSDSIMLTPASQVSFSRENSMLEPPDSTSGVSGSESSHATPLLFKSENFGDVMDEARERTLNKYRIKRLGTAVKGSYVKFESADSFPKPSQ